MKLPNPVEWWFKPVPIETQIVTFTNDNGYTHEVVILPTPDNLLDQRRIIVERIGLEASHTLRTEKRPLPPSHEAPKISYRGPERG